MDKIILIIVIMLSTSASFATTFPTHLYPKSETEFISIINEYATASRNIDNELKLNKLKKERSDKISLVMKAEDNNVPKNWYGVVEHISTNSKGLGILHVKISENIEIGTWNNSYSDYSFNTLISPSDKLYDVVSELNEGDIIKFTGLFHSALRNRHKIKKADILKAREFYEARLTLRGGLTDPFYVFTFWKIEKVEI